MHVTLLTLSKCIMEYFCICIDNKDIEFALSNTMIVLLILIYDLAKYRYTCVGRQKNNIINYYDID